jgi:hypothetical protein
METTMDNTELAERRAPLPAHVPAYAWLGAGVTILIQIVALVWGAATMASSVDHLSGTVAEGRAALRELNERTRSMELELTQLQTQVRDQAYWMQNPPAWYTQPPSRKP